MINLTKILFFCFSLINCQKTNGQSVDFTISTPNNLFCAPQAVSFAQNCTGSPDGFIWDFGNGVTSSNPNAVITYAAAGNYTVTLTATFANSAISVSKTVIINPTPTITINASRTYLCQPGNITFTAPGSPFLNSYEWNFGDGSPLLTTPGNTATHFFNTYNNFTVTVRGITANNCSATASMQVNVTKFNITASVLPTSGCIPINTSFTATITLPTGDAPLNFNWDFGDGTPNGNTVTGNTTHIYNTTNTINTASVLITSTQGCTNQFDFPVFAFGTPPFATNAYTALFKDTFCGSDIIRFNATATNANLYVWDFGDGSNGSSIDTTITHEYNTLGDQQVILTPYFNGCAGQTDTLNIFIEGVIADYDFNNQCNNKNSFFYTNLSIGNITNFAWSFSDNLVFKDSVNFNISHLFPVSGSFQTKLYLYDSVTGCRDSLITIQYTATPTLTSTKTAVCKDSLIQYSVNNTYAAAGGFLYNFHVNGNIVDAGTIPSLNFNPSNFGSFNEFVVIIDPNGNNCNDTLYLNQATNVRGPFVSFMVPPETCAINAVSISNNSFPFFNNDSIIKWEWDFGDNTKDSIQNPPPHLYSGASSYTITLKATDKNNCVQDSVQTVIVYPMPIIKTLPGVDTICLGQTIQLTAYTVDTLLWIPNNNISCVTCDTTFVSPVITTSYIAQARNAFGCMSRDTSLIKVYGPINLQILPSDTTVCPQQMVSLRTNTIGITNWSPGTYLSAANIPNPVSVPDTSILYTVIVSDSVGCYADTTTANVRTFNRARVNAGPDFIVPYNSNFTLTPVYSNNIASYIWDPLSNGLNCNNCPTPGGIAKLTEMYTIDVISVNGCKASDTITMFVQCDKANIYIPNAFTPNGDGKNDYFYPVTRGYNLINNLTVYNRWGNKVFERKNFAPNTENLGWNGFNGVNQAIEPGTYVWFAEATCDLGEKIKTKGTVVLIR